MPRVRQPGVDGSSCHFTSSDRLERVAGRLGRWVRATGKAIDDLRTAFANVRTAKQIEHRKPRTEEPWALRNTLPILVAGGAVAILAFSLGYWTTGGDDKDRFDVGIKAATPTAAIVAGILTWGRLELSRGEHRLGVDRDLTERYGRAVEQLGNHETIIRVGGVFAMERFALDALALSGEERDTDWRMTLDLLADFARERSAHRDAAGPPTISPGDPGPRELTPGPGRHCCPCRRGCCGAGAGTVLRSSWLAELLPV